MQPSLFISHGAPTLALEPSPAREFLVELGKRLHKPDAIIIISAHHLANGVAVTSDPAPKTIHDFGGFPGKLYDLNYLANGSPQLAQEIVDLLKLKGFKAFSQSNRGLDHGAWIPLMLIFPSADIPIVQVSIDLQQGPLQHFRLGQALATLRDRNILLIGSGSITHNLKAFFDGSYAIDAQAPYWVSEFSDWIANKIAAGDVDEILNAIEIGPHGKRNHPTPDHILPLFVTLGAGNARPGKLIHSSTTYGVLSMDAFAFDLQNGRFAFRARE